MLNLSPEVDYHTVGEDPNSSTAINVTTATNVEDDSPEISSFSSEED